MSKVEDMRRAISSDTLDADGSRFDAAAGLLMADALRDQPADWAAMMPGVARAMRVQAQFGLAEPGDADLVAAIGDGYRRFQSPPPKYQVVRAAAGGFEVQDESRHCLVWSACEEHARRAADQMNGRNHQPPARLLNPEEAETVLAAFPRLARDPGEDDGSDVGDRFDGLGKAVRDGNHG